MASAPRLLEGIRVIDAASFIAGPVAATVMADFGADVIKVEPPTGDTYRIRNAGYPPSPYNFPWIVDNRSKRGVAIDLRTEDDARPFASLDGSTYPVVSPDGRRYVYMDYTQGGLYVFGQIHVVDVATGRDRTLDLPAAEYEIFDFSADGIYLTYGPYAESAGLWLLNPDSGAIRQVFQDGYVVAVANGEAWLVVSEQDLHPTSPLPGGEGNAKLPVLNVLLRRDVKSGQVTEWLRRPECLV